MTYISWRLAGAPWVHFEIQAIVRWTEPKSLPSKTALYSPSLLSHTAKHYKYARECIIYKLPMYIYQMISIKWKKIFLNAAIMPFNDIFVITIHITKYLKTSSLKRISINYFWFFWVRNLSTAIGCFRVSGLRNTEMRIFIWMLICGVALSRLTPWLLAALDTHHMDHFTGLPKTCQLPSLRTCDPWDLERDYIQDEKSFYNPKLKIVTSSLMTYSIGPTTLKESLPRSEPPKWGPLQGPFKAS